MLLVLFIAITLTSLFSVTARSFRRLLISLLGVYFFSGVFALQLGAEFFALACWLTGATLTLVLKSYGVSFGELIEPVTAQQATPRASLSVLHRVKGFLPAASVFTGVGLAWMLTMALSQTIASAPNRSENVSSHADQKLYQLGEAFLNAPYLSTLVLGLAVFTGVLGVGAITRPRVFRVSSESESRVQP